MKITSWNDDYIFFSDGSKISYEHDPDCCESNWADFSVLDVFYNDEEFDKYYIRPIKEAGFLLCMERAEEPLYDFDDCDFRKKIFIPCYSDQNGYYSDDIDIVITKADKSNQVINLICDLREY